MITFGMIVLTLLTVLGSAMLGWLARRYALGGRCEPFGSDELAKSLPEGSGLAAGAIGTVAAGTAAMRYVDNNSDAKSSGSADTGAAGAASAKFSSGTSSDTLKSGSGGSTGHAGARGSDVSGSSSSDVSGLAGATTGSSHTGSSASDVSSKAEWFDGGADGAGSANGLREENLSTDPSGSAVAATAGSTAAASALISGNDAQMKVGGAISGDSALDLSDQDPAMREGSDAGADALAEPSRGGSASLSSGSNIPQNDSSGSFSSLPTSSDRSSTAAPAALAGAGLTAGGLSVAADDDEEDGGVVLVDIPATMSAEETEAERLLASDEVLAAPASRLDAPRGNQSPDDLTKIKGIGPKINGQLNDRGIYYYDQIADFSGSDLAWADRELGFKGRAVRDRWIPQARGLMDAPALDGSDRGLASSAKGMQSAELTASQAEVRQLRTRLDLNPDSGSSANDPDKSDAARLEASQQEARDLRQQIWSKEQAEKAAAESAANSKPDATAATGSGSFGGLSAEETEAEKLIASGSAPKSASNRLDAPTPGFDPDNLTKIQGIGKPTQSRLNRNGIYYYDQIAGFTAADLAWANNEMNLEGRVISDRWIPQAKALAGETDGDGAAAAGDAGSTTAAGFANLSDGDNDSGSDGELLVDVPSGLTEEEAEAERLLASGEEIAPPANRLEAPHSGRALDDLTRIKGIGPKINSKLNDQGIYYYDQIAGFKGSDLAWADRELNFKGRAVRDRWVPQARGLMELSDSAASAAPAPKTLLEKPIEGRSPDDLTEIKGVGNVLQAQLNEKGIYYYSQIAEFSDSDQEWANQTLGFPGRVERDNWIPQAKELAAGRATRRNVLSDAGKELGALSVNEEPGEMSGDESEAMRLIESGNFVADESNRPASLLQSASNGPADDLQRIKGVGPKLNSLLNSLGIYYFRQIADFSATDIAWVDSKLQFKGRIVRDRWVDQAKRLS